MEDFMAPLLTDGAGREAYTPWGHRDMATLADRLPTLTAGALAWIRKFKAETAGDVLALGDIRAIIGRSHGTRQIIELERLTETANLVDRTSFDRYQNLFWGCLRELFPANTKKAGISNLHIKPEENIYQYIQRAEDLWLDRNDGRASDSKLALQMFQQALIQGLKPAVQKLLKLVASLDYMSWEQWVEQLVHHYHLDQEKQEEKGDEYEELRIQFMKMKIKEQADPNKKAKNTQEPLIMMPLATQPPTPRASTPTTPNTTRGVPGLGASDARPQRYTNRGVPGTGASGDLTTRMPTIQLPWGHVTWPDIRPAPAAIPAATVPRMQRQERKRLRRVETISLGGMFLLRPTGTLD
ncbi:hypothetical protein N1851_024331 [Merluccius polli]|uniref:Uncharacterized protein n=1 Tax=Merluccius polli TaxID=89951 RepID=A0AA47MFD4_MERPO|nr:hypothetical protein N1851_024331 [Merluccius polli]